MLALNRRKSHAGFTLIEISIVLIIIGLLLGGVLKGQTMVKNSKIKRIAADAQAFMAATNAYLDSYWALPGDDLTATTNTRWGVNGGDGAGTIGPGAASNDAIFIPIDFAQENARAIGHLRCAQLLNGRCVLPTAAADLPRNAVGGNIGIDDGNSPEDDMLDITTKVICQNNLEWDYALVYDTQFDNGLPGTGEIRGSAANTFATGDALAATYATGSTYYVCASF